MNSQIFFLRSPGEARGWSRAADGRSSKIHFFSGDFFDELSIPLQGSPTGNMGFLLFTLLMMEIIHEEFRSGPTLVLLVLLSLLATQTVFFSQLLFMNPIQCYCCGSKAPTSHPQTPDPGVHPQWISMEDIQLPVINMAMENLYIGILTKWDSHLWRGDTLW